jgi:hypothetical protein
MTVSPAIIPASRYEEVRSIEASLQQKSARVILVEAADAGSSSGKN